MSMAVVDYLQKKARIVIFVVMFLVLVSFCSAELSFYHEDHLGNVVLVTDEAGQVVYSTEYEPFGEEFNVVGEETFSYNAKELDESNLYYYGSRYYDANLGRFITVDVVEGEPKNPQSLNRYVYVRNNPVLYKDPTGNAPYHFSSYRMDKEMSQGNKEALALGVVAGVAAPIMLKAALTVAPTVLTAVLSRPGAINTATELVEGALNPGPSVISAVPASSELKKLYRGVRLTENDLQIAQIFGMKSAGEIRYGSVEKAVEALRHTVGQGETPTMSQLMKYHITPRATRQAGSPLVSLTEDVGTAKEYALGNTNAFSTLTKPYAKPYVLEVRTSRAMRNPYSDIFNAEWDVLGGLHPDEIVGVWPVK